MRIDRPAGRSAGAGAARARRARCARVRPSGQPDRGQRVAADHGPVALEQRRREPGLDRRQRHPRAVEAQQRRRRRASGRSARAHRARRRGCRRRARTSASSAGHPHPVLERSSHAGRRHLLRPGAAAEPALARESVAARFLERPTHAARRPCARRYEHATISVTVSRPVNGRLGRERDLRSPAIGRHGTRPTAVCSGGHGDTEQLPRPPRDRAAVRLVLEAEPPRSLGPPTRLTVKAGRTSLVDQGQMGHECFVIVDGEATVDAQRQEDRHDRPRRPLRRAGPARRRAPHRHGHGHHRPRPARARPAPVPRPARGAAGLSRKLLATLAGQVRRLDRPPLRLAPRPRPAGSGPGPLQSGPRVASTFGVRMGSKFGTARKLIIGIGIAFAVVTLASGISGWIFESSQVDDSPKTREVFVGIPGPLDGRLLHRRAGPARLRRGARSPSGSRTGSGDAPTTGRPRRQNVKRRLADFRAGVYMQTLLRDPAAGVMHSLIYFSFLVLLGVTTVLEINHQLPDEREVPPRQRVRGATRSSATPPALVFLIGVVWAIVRRYVQRPYRIRIKTKPEHAVILGVVPRASASPASSPRCSASPMVGTPDFEKWSLRRLPAVEAGRRTASPPRTAGTRSCGSSHVVDVLRLPGHPADHDAAPHVHVAAEHVPARPRPAQGRDEADAEPDGDRARDASAPSTVEDFTWKQLLDTDACTMCGRCTSRVPGPRHRQAARSARDRAEDRRGHGRAPARPVVSPPIGVDAEIIVAADSLFERITRRGGLGVHVVQGVRRDLPGQHRDPRQDPRHAALPVADGVELPHRAGQRLPRRWRTRATRGA